MSVRNLSGAAVGLLLMASASPAWALSINVNYDSSVKTLANGAGTSVMQAFNKAAAEISSMFSSPIQVNLNVSWGKVGSYALPSGALGASSTSLYGYFTYDQVRSWLTSAKTTLADTSALASLPATVPAGLPTRYVLTSAQARALGLIAARSTAIDGSIGFGLSPSGYTFNDAAGVAKGTYDFVAVAEHEISEVLGRISGLTSTKPSYATVLDLFRFSATGVHSSSYTSSAYFSIDNGVTDLANFNHSTSGGDRGDWLSTATTTDAADAFAYPGVNASFSAVDRLTLDVSGLDASGNATLTPVVLSTTKGLALLPEPASMALFGAGLLGLAALRRRGAGKAAD